MIQSPIILPCGQVISNRICKAAMTERLSRIGNAPNDLHLRLYEQWTKSGAGLHISGNIMVDRKHMESAGNLVLDDVGLVEKYLPLTHLVTSSGSQFWSQINHPGRQTNYMINMRPSAPSSVWLKRGGFFLPPRTLKEEEIEDLIQQFVRTSELCLKGGFTGIQIHAAHGYLISQFLSPLTNRRNDRWGGSLANRSRFLYRIVEGIREKIPSAFPLSVKLNSADFQRGGFTDDESLEVVQNLDGKIDLLEISGGTYETQAMMGEHETDRTKKREAYFLEFAQKVKGVYKGPIMVTGGFRTRATIEGALEKGLLDLVGIARPFCTQTELMRDFISGKCHELNYYFKEPKNSFLNFSAEGGYYAKQIVLMAHNKAPQLNMSGNRAGHFIMAYETKKALYKRIFS